MTYSNIVGASTLGNPWFNGKVVNLMANYLKPLAYNASEADSFVLFMETTISPEQTDPDISMHKIAEVSFAEIWDDPAEDIWDKL